MADTGYNWDDTWTNSGQNDAALANDAGLASSTISLDGKAACLVSISLEEEDANTPDGGPVTVYVKHGADDTINFESQLYGGSPWSFTIVPTTASQTVRKVFVVDAGSYDDFQVYVYNECGYELQLTIQHKFATIPAAS